MATMICPTCAQAYDRRAQCPRCRMRLLPAVASGASSPSDPMLVSPRRRSVWSRIIIGVFVSQGLFLAVYHLLLAGALAADNDAATHWSSLYGVLALQAVQLGALLVGSMLSGAAVGSGAVLYGSIVGVWNGILCVLFQNLMGESVTAVAFYGQPVLQTAFGALGGWLGARLWPPLSAGGYEREQPRLTVFKPRPIFAVVPSRPHWGRILLGAVMVIAGILWADTILRFVIKAGEIRTLRTSMEQWILTLEISMLAVFIGAAFAGAATANGATQGAWVGIFSSTFLLGYSFFYRDLGSGKTLVLLIAAVLCLSYLGGSFGSRLLPPVAARSDRRYRPASL